MIEMTEHSDSKNDIKPMLQVLIVFVFSPLALYAPQQAAHADDRTFYIDSVGGNDANDGLTPLTAWRSHTKVSSVTLAPGDVVSFKNGSAFSGPVEIKQSGTSSSPIRFTSYGTGEPPKFTNSNKWNMNGNCFRISADHIIIENLYFHDTPGSSSWSRTNGIFKTGAIVNMIGSDHNTIRNNTFMKCVKAVQSTGEYTVITGNYMDGPVNSALSYGWGPIGIHLGIGNQEVSHNTIKNYRYIGGAFGSDGGAIELDDGRFHKDNFYIHHNYTEGNAGFLESSWEYDNNPYVQEVHNLRVAFNISHDGQQWLYMWAPCHDTYFDNNTVIRPDQFGCPQQNNDVALLHVQGGKPFDASQIHFRNNLFVYDGQTAGVYQGRGAGGCLKTNNWYLNYDNYSAVLGGDSNKAGDGDPLCVDLDGGDYHLTADSPLIGEAQNLSQYYSTDFDGVILPTSGPWDVGALQFVPEPATLSLLAMGACALLRRRRSRAGIHPGNPG